MALRVLTPIHLVWRREIDVADADITTTSSATNGDGDALALDTNTVDIVAGQWVTLDTSGKATLATSPTLLAYIVDAGGDRLDVNVLTQVAVLHGVYIARTDQFRSDTGDVYAPGTTLTVEDGILRPASGSEAVVAVAEGAPSAVTSAFPNGELSIKVPA